MIDKFFGFTKIEDELSVIGTLLEHAKIDEEELHLMILMCDRICENKMDDAQELYIKIRHLIKESINAFENTPDHIINANFDHQKQYDLLRLYQRNEAISKYIIASAKRLVILCQLNCSIPSELHDELSLLMEKLKLIHKTFITALEQYTKTKRGVFTNIQAVENLEQKINSIRGRCLTIMYHLGNDQKLLLGNFHALIDVIDHFEELADVITESATSLEWLLL